MGRVGMEHLVRIRVCDACGDKLADIGWHLTICRNGGKPIHLHPDCMEETSILSLLEMTMNSDEENCTLIVRKART